MVLPAAVRPIGVGHVSRRLLEVRHQAAPLEHLRQHVRDAFAGDVRAAELCDRIVAVLVEHARVELVGARETDRAAARRRRGTDLVEKLVQEEPPQRLGRSRVAREQRALDRFRQIGQREDRPIGVGEVRRQRARLGFGEGVLGLRRNAHSGASLYRGGRFPSAGRAYREPVCDHGTYDGDDLREGELSVHAGGAGRLCAGAGSRSNTWTSRRTRRSSRRCWS